MGSPPKVGGCLRGFRLGEDELLIVRRPSTVGLVTLVGDERPDLAELGERSVHAVQGAAKGPGQIRAGDLNAI